MTLSDALRGSSAGSSGRGLLFLRYTKGVALRSELAKD